MKVIRTQVGILGAGPAGLLLGQLLHRQGIDTVVVERQSRQHVETRIRAGVLEQGTADLLQRVGAGDRMLREGLRHHGIELRFLGQGHRIDFQELAGRAVTVYAQHEVIKDLIAARAAAGAPLFFDAGNTRITGLEDEPRIHFTNAGAPCEIACDYIAGCDGFHGISRTSIPPDALTIHEKVYPFGWLGILANARPASHELIYTHHKRGFALLSMRSPVVSRLYLQCAPDEDLEQWPDARIWEELQARFATRDGFRLEEGSITQKGVTAMRSFVAEPMRYHRLFLAGDAAHIVPPTGAKGLNLAAADVWLLSQAFADAYRTGGQDQLDRYSARALRRVWRVQQFSWWMTSLLHQGGGDAFDGRRQLAELDQVVNSRAAATLLAQNYTGLPFDEF